MLNVTTAVPIITCTQTKPIEMSDRSVEWQLAFDINTKIATGMINAGIGETHVNTMFSSMSLPTMHNRTLKRKEKLAGEAITHVAKRSCQQALRDEVMSSKKPWIDVSYDGGWQKRGSGRDYKSLSGNSEQVCMIVCHIKGHRYLTNHVN
ncbi:uncharacterized protein LOC144442215 [Glandiceps talaboti]